jgi:hypothetical protein
MYAFRCLVCGTRVRFEDDRCRTCGDPLGYRPDLRQLVNETDPDRPFAGWHRCSEHPWGCNWLVHDDNPSARCDSCRLNRTVPPRDDTIAWEQLAVAARSERRLVHQLRDLGLPITSYLEKPDGGLAFDLLSSTSGAGPVMIGHANGVISVDLAESSDRHRESVRVWLDESYRTMLGHFRHEIGHYYWQVLVPDTDWEQPFRDLFGDERADYGQALQRHYARDPATTLPDEFITRYASSHPWEDFAEIWSHYLHITDTVQTAIRNGLVADPRSGTDRSARHGDFDPASGRSVLVAWTDFSWAFNELNRSMGKPDAYPFELAEPVVDKLLFVHKLIRDARVGSTGPG